MKLQPFLVVCRTRERYFSPSSADELRGWSFEEAWIYGKPANRADQDVEDVVHQMEFMRRAKIHTIDVLKPVCKVAWNCPDCRTAGKIEITTAAKIFHDLSAEEMFDISASAQSAHRTISPDCAAFVDWAFPDQS